MSDMIDYYDREHWAATLQVRVSYQARRRMFASWRDFAGPVLGSALLDVGGTPDTERQDSNCMVPWFRDAGLSVSLYSPEDLSGLASAFSFATILPSQGFGRPIPAQDGTYDWVSASAVLEHVGSAADQIAFIRECARVGRGLFITTPNRWHWLEFHTKLPLLHWLPRDTHRTVLRTFRLPFWAEEKNLRLVGGREFAELAEAALGTSWDWTIRTVNTLAAPSNLLLLGRRVG
jgi:hypothetical protein